MEALSPRARSRDYGATALLVLLALVARVACALALPQAPAWDGVLYERAARAIASGLGYTTFMFPQRSSDTVPTAFYPVGYPAYVALFYALFGPHLAVLRLAGAAAGAATVGLVHRLAHRFQPGWGARLAALGLALMPGQVLFASAAMTETLFGALLVLAVYLAARPAGGPRARDLVALGVALAAATYVRPQAALLAPLLAAARAPTLSPLGTGLRARAAAAALCTGVMLACVLPWTARNCARLDGCAFVSTNGGSNLAIGAVPRANGRFFFLGPTDGCTGVVGEVARDRCWRGVALAAIRANPGRWLALSLAKLDHTLSYEAFPAGYLRESGTVALDDARERTLRRALTAPWRVLLALALLALVSPGRRSPLSSSAWLSLGTALVVLATHLAFFGGDRYHLPVAPLLCVLAAGALRELGPPRGVVLPARARREVASG